MSYKITDTIIVDNNKNIGSIGTALFAGPVIIGGGNSTGTVSQPLQVTGTNGAYIGGNLGIGSTNPTSKLWVSGDIYNTGIHTAQVLNASKDPGTGIATDFTNSLFGNGWRVSSPGSTTYYKLATLPPGGGGNTFDHLTINGVLGAWTNGNQTPFEITFSNRGSFNYKYVSYGSVRTDVRIIGISTNSSVEIWAQHQASQFTKLVYNIPNSIESIVVSNPTSTTTAPTGTTVFDSSTATPRFIINESDYVGIGTATPTSKLTVQGDVTITGLTTTNNLYVSGVGTFLSSGLKIRNPANTFGYTIAGDAIGADYTLTLPVVTANTGIALTGIAQTFTAAQTFNSSLTAVSTIALNGSTTANNNLATNSTTATLTVGGTSQTGTMTLGRSTVTQQTDIQAGVSGVGTSKTINFGTGGGSGSFTNINIGPTAGVGTVVINSGTNLDLTGTAPGTASKGLLNVGSGGLNFPTSNLIATFVNDVSSFTGISVQNKNASGQTDVTVYNNTGSYGDLGVNGSTSNLGGVFGDYNGTYLEASGGTLTVGTISANDIKFATNSTEKVRITSSGNVGIGTTNPVGQLQVSSGPVIIGAATSTGTASQPLQVTGGAYVSGSVGIGTTNPTSKLTVTGDVLVSGVSTSLTSINTPFYTNPSTITSSYTVPINQNSFTAGPIGIDTGITISVSSGSYLKVI